MTVVVDCYKGTVVAREEYLSGSGSTSLVERRFTVKTTIKTRSQRVMQFILQQLVALGMREMIGWFFS